MKPRVASFGNFGKQPITCIMFVGGCLFVFLVADLLIEPLAVSIAYIA